MISLILACVLSADPAIEGKQWNRWTTKNFVILSIDNDQGKYLHENLEPIKTNLLTRWGFRDVNFTTECRLVCVKDPALYQKLFNLNKSKVEIRDDEKLNVIFYLLNDQPSKVIPSPLTEVALVEFEKKNNAKFGWWFHRGMALLNGEIESIRTDLGSLNNYLSQDKEMFFSKALFNTKRESWAKFTEDQKTLFDIESEALCLLLRKEFGQNKLHWFLKESQQDPEKALQKIYGFKGYEDFDGSFKRFMTDLSSDILGKNNRTTPDNYLTILAK